MLTLKRNARLGQRSRENSMQIPKADEAMLMRQRRKINWGTGVFLVIAHAVAISALFFWSWPAFISAVILYWVAGSLGIGMGFHRLITHRGYRVPKIVEYFLVTCGALALEGGPIRCFGDRPHAFTLSSTHSSR